MKKLWSATDDEAWDEALESYAAVIEAQGVDRLPELDRWYREELPAAIAARDPRAIDHDELVKVTEWKMARGIWRGRNLALVRGNEAAAVKLVSRGALGRIPDPSAPIAELARLDGVGPATASAVASAAAPGIYPFFDEIVASQVPGLDEVVYNLAYYARYAAALRERADRLGGDWTPTLVERALWANAGGKAGAKARAADLR